MNYCYQSWISKNDAWLKLFRFILIIYKRTRFQRAPVITVSAAFMHTYKAPASFLQSVKAKKRCQSEMRRLYLR